MSTATSVSVDLPVTKENITYCRVAVPAGKDEAGVDKFEYEVKTEEVAKKLEEEGKGQIEVTQTFAIPRIGTQEGFEEVFGENPREGYKMASNGLAVKLQNKARALLQAKDEDGNFSFEPVEGARDLTEFASVETATRGGSVLEKVKKLIPNLPPDQVAQLLAALQAQSATE